MTPLAKILILSLLSFFFIASNSVKVSATIKEAIKADPAVDRLNVTNYINGMANASNHQSFVGSVSVRDNNASIFYQLFSAKDSPIEDNIHPLIIWLQGGPGCSSLIGAYDEMGPYLAANFTNGNKTETRLQSNPNSWANVAHMLFIEQPIGVGFSNLGNNSIPNNTESVAKDFETFLVKFYGLFPTLKNNDLYIFGESFGGHYIPGFASYIVQNAQTNNIKLAGIGIGDGWTDPFRQLTSFAAYGYSTGIISNSRRSWIKSQEARVSDLIYSGSFTDASGVFDNMTGVGDTQYPDSIVTKSGDVVVYNFRQYTNQSDNRPAPSQVFLNLNTTKEAFGLKNNSNFTWSQCNDQMYLDFYPDISKSYKQNISYLLKNTRVLLYNGQDDIIVNTAGAQTWINSLSWSGIRDWQRTPKQIWNMTNNTVGTVRQYSNLSVATVYKAGHMVPEDQGPSSLDMLTKWLSNTQNWGYTN